MEHGNTNPLQLTGEVVRNPRLAIKSGRLKFVQDVDIQCDGSIITVIWWRPWNCASTALIEIQGAFAQPQQTGTSGYVLAARCDGPGFVMPHHGFHGNTESRRIPLKSFVTVYVKR